MKKTLKILATLVLASALSLYGCDPEDPITPEEETLENVFAGTSWVCHLENTIVQQGIQMNIDYDVSLDFLDTVNVEMFQEVYIDVPAYPSASQSNNQTDAFTYSFTKDSVFLHSIDTSIDETDALAYDKEANTLTIDFNDAEMESIMGTSTVVFTPRQMNSTKISHSRTTDSTLGWKPLVRNVLQTIGR
ncbi:MAG: hypothetical protein Q4D03_09150 [Bacteroidales bacterium]|nr:hypothetical protein [Bacteroidales bacterium]